MEVGQSYEVLEDESRGDFPLRKGDIVTVILANASGEYGSYCIVEANRDIVRSHSYNANYRHLEILNENCRRVWISKRVLKLYMKLPKKRLGDTLKL